MITESYPLQWPAGRPRTESSAKKWGGFKTTSSRIRDELYNELRKMDIGDYVISSNLATRRDGLPYAGQKAPEDTGVALYFTRKGQEICISCDQYVHIDSNLRAIGLTVAAIRGMERWGTEEMVDRAFTGFTALPESIITPPPSRPYRGWYQVLGIDQQANALEVKAAYRDALKLHHPDAGGDPLDLKEIQQAYEEWKSL